MTPSLRLGDRYRLEAKIGHGGMSEVWRARDEVLNRPVAIKVLADGRVDGVRAGTIIRDEALATARLSHPNIASVYDYAEAQDEHGQPVAFIVMELIVGDPLADLLSRGPLPTDLALRTAGEVAAALGAAHAHGLVHRDVKPGNIIVTPFGAKVFDFGIAAATGEPDRRDEQGRILGTPVFVSPERLAGAPVTPASDMYAFGVLLQRLFGPTAPSDVERLRHRCLAADPSSRPTAAQARSVISGSGPVRRGPVGVARVAPAPPLSATTYFDPPAPRRTARRRRSLMVAAAMLMALGLSLVALAAERSGHAATAAQYVPTPSSPPPAPAPAAAPAAENATEDEADSAAESAAETARCGAAQAYARALSRLKGEPRKGYGNHGNGKPTTYPATCGNGVPVSNADR